MSAAERVRALEAELEPLQLAAYEAYWQLSEYVQRSDGFWHCPSAPLDSAVAKSGDDSPLIGYMGNMYAIGISTSASAATISRALS